MSVDGKRILCRCPAGHDLRGSVELIGKTVTCPGCGEPFVFGYAIRESLSDAAVLKILIGSSDDSATADSAGER